MQQLLDKVVTTKKLVGNENGNPIIETTKTIVCSMCGHANSITTSQCKMCGNYLEIEEEDE